MKLPPHVFMLRDPTYGVAYEGFDLKDVKEGSVIEVRDPVLEGEAEAAAAEARSLQADHNVGPASYFTVDAASAFDFKRDRKKDREDVVDGGGGGGAAGGEDGTSTDADAGGDAAAAPAAAEPPKKDEALDAALLWAKTKYGWHVELPLTFKEKTWQFLDDPKVRSIHWSPYDRVGVVNADPQGLLPSSLSAHTSVSIPALDAFQLHLTPLNSTPIFARMERP